MWDIWRVVILKKKKFWPPFRRLNMTTLTGFKRESRKVEKVGWLLGWSKKPSTFSWMLVKLTKFPRIFLKYGFCIRLEIWLSIFRQCLLQNPKVHRSCNLIQGACEMWNTMNLQNNKISGYFYEKYTTSCAKKGVFK